MPENSLEVRLEATDQRPGHFLLTCNSVQYPLTLNPEVHVTFSNWLRRLRSVLVGRNDPAGELTPEALLRNVGTWLWQALLPESAPVQQRDTLVRALRSGHSPLLLTLSDTLAGLPWELLCDPEQPAEQGFLACRRPLMRFIASDTPELSISPPLRVLLLISSPPGLGEDSRVDVESERAAVEQVIYDVRETGLLHLLVEDIVTPKRVQQALIRFKPHVVHYIGHGGYDERTGGVLLWEDEGGDILPISDVWLANILRPRNVHAVVLHACETGRRNARTDVYGVAGTLVKEGIPAILAQQANFTYESSQRASEAWYTVLTARQSFCEALFEVRQALIQADRPDWAVPILQGNAASLAPVLDASAGPHPPDPLLTSQGAAADLPTPTGIFVGRHRELRALRLMLERTPGSGPALALITGPGGVGKSTLAAQAVIRYGGKYKATLTLSCLGYQSVELFLQRIGEVLKRQGAPGFLEYILPDPKLSTTAKIEEAIIALNQTGPFLLLVDNLESVQNEDQTLRDKGLLQLLQKLLTNLRGGRILITGRYAVKDLLPDGKFAAHLLRLDLDDLSPYETNQLLMRYPTLAQLGETVRQTLIDEFGGLPYMYDLLSSKAASQNLELLIHDVQGRITQECKRRTAEEWKGVRRQVVEFAALGSTINRLPESSRTLLARLGVLRRPFPLAAIEQELRAARAEWQPLLDWSLLQYDPLERSYRLHSITRRYVEDLLDEQDRRQTQAKLAAWYQRYAANESLKLVDFLEAHRLWRASGKVRQAGELVMQLAETLRRFGLYPLLRELCTTTLHDIGEYDEQLLVAYAQQELGRIAQDQGNYEEARELYQQSREIYEPLGDQRGRASAMYGLGQIAHQQGNYEEARGLYGQSLQIAEQLGDQGGRASVMHELGNLASLQGNYEEARGLYEQSLGIKERLGDQRGRADSLGQLGNIAQDQGNYEEARGLYQQSREIYERLGDQRGQAASLHQMGIIAHQQGNYEEARECYEQSLQIDERLGDQRGRANSLGQLGMIAYEQGNYEEAREFYGQSLQIGERLGDQKGQATSLHKLGMIAHEQGNYEEARGLYGQSLQIGERLGDQKGRATSLHQLGMMAQDQGNYEEAREFYEQSRKIYERLGDQKGQATSLHQLGMIAHEQGHYEEARGLYQQSLRIKERLRYQKGRADSLGRLGIIAHEQGNDEEARKCYEQSLQIAERLEDQKGRATSLHHLGLIAQDQGNYEEARALYQQSKEIYERLEDQKGQAASLQLLGMIARYQRNYEEAREFYQQSREIYERLGDQRGQAASLEQLGVLAYEQADLENAVKCAIQAFILFSALHSPSRIIVQQLITSIHSQMDEATFAGHWRAIAGDLPLPGFSSENANQQIMQTLTDFIQAPTWEESKRILESHPELLQPEIDAALQQQAMQQENDSARKHIEEYRLLLDRCRNMGIDVAFAELQGEKSPEAIIVAALNHICSQVVVTLRTRNARQQKVAANLLEHLLEQVSPIQGVQDFLQVLVIWLRGQDTLVLAERLQPHFRNAYAQMIAAVEREETENAHEDGALAIEDLPGVVSSVMLQGTAE